MDTIRTLTCTNCGELREVGAPCPDCKFQPYTESCEAPTSERVPETVTCPECGAERSTDPTQECARCKELDVCPTPDALALAICQRLEQTTCRDHYQREPFRILEPSAGRGAFVRAARATWPASVITAIEPRVQCRDDLLAAGADSVWSQSIDFDDTYISNIAGRQYDLVIGNPPFSLAEEHIRLLLGSMKPGAVLAFLLRTGFYESFERLPFWREFPEDSFAPIVPRPNFKLNRHGKKGTDSQSYGLFIWTNRRRDDGVLCLQAPPKRELHLVWREQSPRGRRKAPAMAPAVDPEAPELE